MKYLFSLLIFKKLGHTSGLMFEVINFFMNLVLNIGVLIDFFTLSKNMDIQFHLWDSCCQQHQTQALYCGQRNNYFYFFQVGCFIMLFRNLFKIRNYRCFSRYKIVFIVNNQTTNSKREASIFFVTLTRIILSSLLVISWSIAIDLPAILSQSLLFLVFALCGDPILIHNILKPCSNRELTIL